MRVGGLGWVFASVAVVVAGTQAAVVAAEESEKYEFQAEVSRLMDIIVNSIYSKKEIFLREVISNAADALDKIRFLSLEDPALLESGKDLEIRISFDEAERTLTIRDSGIGMTKHDLIENLGTVAKSGTTQFVEQMTSGGGELSQIGQFGVGFYSVYLVADKVEVRSKHNSDAQHVWESTADSTFSVYADAEGDTLGRGTEIKLHLKEDALEFAAQERLEALVKRYSEFIQFPIYVRKSKTEMVDEDDDEDDEDDDDEDADDEDADSEDEDDDDDDELETEDADEDADAAPAQKEVTTWSWERVNTQQAIWARGASSVSEAEYKDFYKSLTKDYQDPLTWTHFRAEGEVEFKSILFIPQASPLGMERYYETSAALKLYVRKVLITEDFEDLLPKYLNFIKGVVDSDDLPLNVSREGLQQHKILKVLAKKLVRKVLDMLRKMGEAEQALKAKKASGDDGDGDDDDDDDDDDDEEVDEDAAGKYAKFWKAFGKNVKMGVIEDTANRAKLVKLLRYKTTASVGAAGEDAAAAAAAAAAAGEDSLDTYLARAPAWQKDIYYVAGSDMAEIRGSPFLERAERKGVEVLLLDDPLDEYVMQQLPEYDGHKLVSLAKEGVTFGDESADDAKRTKLYKKEFKPLTEWMKKTLGDKVEKVVVSASRVSDAPAMLVTGQFGYSANMERIMKHQAFGSGRAATTSKKTMEVNPRHPIIAKLKEDLDGAADDEDHDEEAAVDLAWLLFDTALLNSGFDMEDHKSFAGRMYRLMQTGLDIDDLALLPEIDVPADEEPAEEPETADMESEKLEL